MLEADRVAEFVQDKTAEQVLRRAAIAALQEDVSANCLGDPPLRRRREERKADEAVED